MKTNRNLYLFAAALVAGTMGMASCSNEEMTPGNQNPTYNGESVKTQFAINIPAAGNTRMTGENTQQPGSGGTTSFKGMHDIYLIPLTATGSSSSTFTNVIPLSDITTDLEGTDKNYKVYEDVNIPVETKNFLFYGMGQSDDPSSPADKFAEGILNNASLPAATKTTDIKFNLEAILSGDDFSKGMIAIVGVLNDVANANDGMNHWKDQSGNTLAKLYTEYKKLKAGYASAVLTTMTELYNAVAPIATSGSGAEKTVAAAIKAKIEASFTPDLPSGDDPYTLTWNVSGADATFPTNLYVPEGAAQVSWSDGTGFVAATELIGTGDKVLNVKNLCYPASLAYFVNTPLKATNSMQVTWPSGTSAWESGFSGWGGEVTAATQTVALQKNIQYSVANLKTSVKCKSASLMDSKNQAITVPGTGFEVTGILIGGQPDQVDWEMKSTSATFDQTVYDKNIVSDMAAKYSTGGDYSDPNYTLVLENTANTTNKKVNIALELKNTTGTDFYGVDGKIAKGMNFYLVAQLDPANVGTEGNKNGLEHVFNQDFVTDAKLTIASLKNAYVTIPDLRAAGFQLGLSVDLTWNDGIVFDVEIQ